MPDDPIIEYLRTRANATQPPDLVGSVVDVVERTPQQRHSWFAPFIPAVAALGVVGSVLVVALLIGQGSRFGPAPSGGPTAEPTLAPTATASDQSVGRQLIEPGDVVQMPGRDEQGEYGTISVTRGEAVGGYASGFANDPDSFYIELFIEYELNREPDGEFGFIDWRVRADAGEEARRIVAEPFAGDGPFDRPLLALYPGAVDVMSTPTEGWVVFAVPRAATESWMSLDYWPEGRASPITSFGLWPDDHPAPPSAIPSPTPVPAPDEADYVERDGLPFSVLDSPEADVLFDTPDTCTNPEGGYTVTFPDDWYTNTEIGDTPACSWFSPGFYEVTDPDEVPAEIAITINAFEGAVGFLWVDLFSEDVEIDGVSGRRFEHGYTKEADTATEQYEYNYLIRLDEDSEGAKIWGITSTNLPGDYALNKAVLDRIMASLEFDDPP